MATTVSASDYLEPKLLDLVFNAVTYTPPSNVFVGAFSSPLTDAGGGTQEGTRQAAAFGAAATRTATTTADLTFTALLAASAWAASTAYAVGDRVATTGGTLQATVAGTSGATEPTAPGTIGDTVVDGTVTWQRIGITHVGIFDAATAGNLLFWGAVDTPVDPAGDDLVIAAGGLDVTLAYGSTSGMSEPLANALLDHVLRSVSYSPATTVEVSLWDSQATPVEVTGGGYARAVTSWAAAAGGSVATDAQADWTNLPAVTVGSVRAYEDAASGGTHLWSWEITPKAFTAGAKASIASGALTATID